MPIVAKYPAEPVPADGTGETVQPNRRPADGTGVVTLDPWLGPFKDALRSRFSKTQKWIKTIDESEGGLEKFSRVRASTLLSDC
jgi:hypothetical protein